MLHPDVISTNVSDKILRRMDDVDPRGSSLLRTRCIITDIAHCIYMTNQNTMDIQASVFALLLSCYTCLWPQTLPTTCDRGLSEKVPERALACGAHIFNFFVYLNGAYIFMGDWNDTPL